MDKPPNNTLLTQIEEVKMDNTPQANKNPAFRIEPAKKGKALS
jgi:hypothetical protein